MIKRSESANFGESSTALESSQKEASIYKGFFIQSSEDEGHSLNCFTDSDENGWSQVDQQAEPAVPCS